MKLVWQIIECADIAISLYLYFYLFQTLFEHKLGKYNHVLTLVLASPIFFITAINSQYVLFSNILDLTVVLYVCLISKFLYRKCGGVKYTVICFIIATRTIIDFFLLFVLGSYFFNIDYPEYIQYNGGYERGVYELLRIVMSLVLIYLFTTKMNLHIDQIKKFHLMLSLCAAIEFLGVVYAQRIFFVELDRILIIDLSVFIICISLVIVILIIYERYRKAQEMEHLIDVRNSMLEANNLELYNLHQKSSHIYHDLKHHINALYLLLNKSEYDEAISYIDKIRGPIKLIEDRVWSGNEVVDMILNYKLAEAKKQNIKLSVDIGKINAENISRNDLCSILANLLDNVIEACTEIETKEKWAEIIIQQRNRNLIIKIRNSIEKEPLNIKGKLITKKKDKEVHGLGIDSVRSIVNKNDGYMEYKFDDKEFETYISLNV